MEASFFSKPLSQSEYRIKITSQLLSESECRNLGHDLTQKTQTNKMAEAWHNADKHYLFFFSKYWIDGDTPAPIGMYNVIPSLFLRIPRKKDKCGQFIKILNRVFRWFKFTLKPPYSITHGELWLAIWDTSFWTFWLKFGHKGPWDIS